MKRLAGCLLFASSVSQGAGMDYATLVASSGKVITFHAEISPYPEQHPTGLLNRYDAKTHTLQRKYETYVQLSPNDPQIVLASLDRIACQTAFTVTGRAKWIDLSGKPDTKTAYSRVWIDVFRVVCDE
jgi:hypothetical protein